MENLWNPCQYYQMPYFQENQMSTTQYDPHVEQENNKTMETLRIQTDYLVSEVNEIKHTLGNFMNDVREQLKRIDKKLTIKEEEPEPCKIKKRKFKKHIQCPYEGCEKKYSSFIALNMHKRQKHKK